MPGREEKVTNEESRWQRQTETMYSGESSPTAETKTIHFHSANLEYPANLMETLWFILMSTRRDRSVLEKILVSHQDSKLFALNSLSEKNILV